jgi:hypothetical protein
MYTLKPRDGKEPLLGLILQGSMVSSIEKFR